MMHFERAKLTSLKAAGNRKAIKKWKKITQRS